MIDDLQRLANELQRLMTSMQMASHALEQGHVAIAMPTLLAPVIEAATEVTRLCEQVPAATRVRASRDPETTHWLDQEASIPTTLTVDKMFPEG